MKDQLKELFAYHRHFNPKFIALLAENRNESTEQLYGLMCHTVNAHNIWNSRIEGKVHGGVNDLRSPEELYSIDEANYQTSLEIMNTRDLSEIIYYKSLKGDPFKNLLSDILFHVVNHSTHHKAQISFGLRRAGIEPIPSDYILYKRQAG